MANARSSSVAREDFDAFYRREFAGMVVLASAILGRRAGAEDVVQDAMVDAHRRWERIGDYDAPRGWLHRVVVQRALKVNRRRSNERAAHLRASVTTNGAESAAELDPGLRTCLEALPTQQRAAMALHYLADLSLEQIGDGLGISEGTVKTHLTRGRSRMASMLRADQTGGGSRG